MCYDYEVKEYLISSSIFFSSVLILVFRITAMQTLNCLLPNQKQCVPAACKLLSPCAKVGNKASS